MGHYKAREHYNFEKKKFEKEPGFVPYKHQTKKLEWYVFENNINARKIMPLNVFEGSVSFIEGLLYAKKKYKNDLYNW